LKKNILKAILPVIMMSSAAAHAEGIQLNGFGSAYGSMGFGDNIVSGYGKDFDGGQLSRIGLNVRSDFNEHFSAVAQILASGDYLAGPGESSKWGLRADWAFLAYSPTENWVFRAGRQLYPGWIISEYQDVGLLQPYVRMPGHVFTLSPFKAFNGFSAEFKTNVADNKLSARVYGGNAPQDFVLGAAGYMQNNFKNLVGLNVNFQGDGYLLRANYVRLQTQTQFTIYNPTASGLPNVNSVSTLSTADSTTSNQVVTAGFKYDKHDLLVMVEGGISRGSGGTPVALVGSGEFLQKISTGYATVGYHIGALMPVYTYGYSNTEIALTSGIARSHQFGLNYYVNPNVVVKGEVILATASGSRITTVTPGSTGNGVALGVDFVF
jgi:hypothetical protein